MYPKFEPGFCLCTVDDDCTYCVQWNGVVSALIRANVEAVETP